MRRGRGGPELSGGPVNFREVRMGGIAPGMLFRSCHPIKEGRQERAISLLASGLGIAAVVNLCDTAPAIRAKAFLAPWYGRLLSADRVVALGMGYGTSGKRHGEKLKAALLFMAATEGPWLVHCQAGIDRTGFVAMVLEALMGATFDEITADYMRSFDGPRGAKTGGPAGGPGSLVTARLLSVMGGPPEPDGQDLARVAESYLVTTVGLAPGEVSLLKEKLAGKA